MDWNGNGKHDGFDDFMDMKLVNGELGGNGSHSGCCLFSFALMVTPLVLIGTLIGTVIVKL